MANNPREKNQDEDEDEENKTKSYFVYTHRVGTRRTHMCNTNRLVVDLNKKEIV